MATPTRAAQANDLGERCSLVIGDFGYMAKTQMPQSQPWLRLRPQASVNLSANYISSDQYLTMRDYDRFSRIVVTDWTKGAYQITYDPSTKSDLSRFYDSANVDVSGEGEFKLIRAMTSLYSGDTTAIRKPMCIYGDRLYVASFSKVGFSSANDWSGPQFANCATSGTIGNTIGGLCTDGQYLYGAVMAGGGAGINRWDGSTSAASLWNTTSTTPRRLIYANRRIYAVSSTVFYEVAIASGTGTADFTLPSGWTFNDLCALRGGAIDAPILVLANQGTASAVWYWDGVTIHDYMTLPNGLVASRMKQYLGVVYITGYQMMPSGRYANVCYAIINGTLSFLGYIAGIPQANGNPAQDGTPNPISMDFFGTGVYVLTINSTTSRNEVWRYDIVYGGWTRYAQVAVPSSNGQQNEDISFWQNGVFFSIGTNSAQNDRVYGQQATFSSTGTLTMSDLNLGQPWASNVWAAIEVTFAPLAAGEAVSLAYSTDGGATFTTTDVSGATMSTTTTGTKTATWLISNSSSSSITPYIRPKATLTAGTSQATTPSFYSLSIKALPAQPPGNVIEAWLACADQMLMPNGQADWQGASGGERLYNIMNLYETQSLTNVIFMSPGPTRAKNPTTLSCVIDDYEILYYPSAGYRAGGGPPIGVEGDVRVVLREVTT